MPFMARLPLTKTVHREQDHALLIDAVPSSVGLADKLRNQVEIIRQQKRLREIDIE